MFKDRLNELLKANRIYQTDLAKHIGYTTQAVSRWCRGETEPDLKTTTKIANYFNVTTDYLLGNVSYKNNEELKEIEALKSLLIKNGFMSKDEDLTEKELDKLFQFVNANKEFLKDNKWALNEL